MKNKDHINDKPFICGFQNLKQMFYSKYINNEKWSVVFNSPRCLTTSIDDLVAPTKFQSTIDDNLNLRLFFDHLDEWLFGPSKLIYIHGLISQTFSFKLCHALFETIWKLKLCLFETDVMFHYYLESFVLMWLCSDYSTMECKCNALFLYILYKAHLMMCIDI